MTSKKKVTTQMSLYSPELWKESKPLVAHYNHYEIGASVAVVRIPEHTPEKERQQALEALRRLARANSTVQHRYYNYRRR